MADENKKQEKLIDTGLGCLVVVAKYYGIPADEQQLKRAYVVAGSMDALGMARAAKEIGLKSKPVQTDQRQFERLPLPLVAQLKNGNYVVVLRREEDGSLVLFDPYRPTPFLLPAANFAGAWNGTVILFTRRWTEEAKKRLFGIRWFLPIVWRYRRQMFQVLFLSLVLQLFGLVSPMFTQIIIDKVLVHRSAPTLDVLVCGMVFVSLFQTWIQALRSYSFTHTTNRIDVILSTKLFRHITALPMIYFEQWQVGDIVARVRELENIRQFITGTALTVVLDAVFALIYIVVMFTYSSYLGLVALVILPAYVLLNLVVTPIYRTRLNEKFSAATDSQSFMIEAVTGIQTVKSLAIENQFIQKWERLLARYIKSAFSTANLANVAGNIGSLIQQIFTLAILWLGALQVMQDKLSVGELVAFQMLAGQVVAPILRLVNLWQNFQQTQVSIDRLGDIMNEGAEPAFNPNRTTLPAITGEIVFDRVVFRYRSDLPEVLANLSLKVKAGSRIGIVGRSGSGKSTLTKLIQRLYVPDSGRVMIDGVDLAQVEPAWLRRQIGVVLQENFLFNGTVRDNIAAARISASDDEVMQAAAISGAHGFISEMPEQYGALVGERGAALSGGQRQRVAIARAILTDPKILIFDEATSALDCESEKIIMDNLNQIAAGRTLIMIAHRLATVRDCDTIFVMERGRLVEAGTHEELLELRGYYHELYMQQFA